LATMGDNANGVFNNKKLNMTVEEKRRLYECMKQKEFHNLLHDYMRDCNDPETLRQQKVYIEQLENKNQLPPGMKILKPKPEFCIKVRTDGGDKVFMNVCSSEHVKKAFPETVERGGLMGTSWKIPYSMNPVPRTVMDKKKVPCTVYDVIFNDKTVAEFRPEQKYLDLVIKTGLEGVSKQMKEKLDVTNYIMLKGVKCKGEPGNLSIRDTDFASKNPQTDPTLPSMNPPISKPVPGFTRPSKEQKKSPETKSPAVTSESKFSIGSWVEIHGLKGKTQYNGRRGVVSGHQAKGRQQIQLSDADRKFFLNVRVENLKKSAKAPATSKAPEFEVPKYTVTECGTANDSGMQFNSERQETAGSRRPKELVVKISIPKITSIKDMDLEIGEQNVSFKAGPYRLLAKLSFPVLAEHGSAKYKKKKNLLVLKLPVRELTAEEKAAICDKNQVLEAARDEWHKKEQEKARLAREKEIREETERKKALEKQKQKEEADRIKQKELDRRKRQQKFEEELAPIRERAMKKMADMEDTVDKPRFGEDLVLTHQPQEAAKNDTIQKSDSKKKVVMLPVESQKDQDVPVAEKPSKFPATDEYFKVIGLPASVNLVPKKTAKSNVTESPDMSMDSMMLSLD
jgi:hypothetical protein